MDYLQTALALVRERAYFSHRVDWESLVAQADTLVSTAPTAGYAVIRTAVEALQDQHSFFVGADEAGATGPQGSPVGYGLHILFPELVVIQLFPESAGAGAGIQRGDVVELVNGGPPVGNGRRLPLDPTTPQRLQLRRGQTRYEVELTAQPITSAPMPYGRYLGDGLGYVELFVQGNPAEGQRYIDTAQEAIRTVAAEGARGWVVDLRCNLGGNMWPMMTGVGPLLGDGLLGQFIEANQQRTSWFYEAGASSHQKPTEERPTIYQSATNPMPTFDPQATPVAVLTSELTGSAGEMTLISFRGRPHTRTFGEVTQGEITAVAIHELADGALLGIAESIAADRTGQEYHEAIVPDEVVPVDWLRYGTADDPVLKAGVRWLRAQLNIHS